MTNNSVPNYSIRIRQMGAYKNNRKFLLCTYTSSANYMHFNMLSYPHYYLSSKIKKLHFPNIVWFLKIPISQFPATG